MAEVYTVFKSVAMAPACLLPRSAFTRCSPAPRRCRRTCGSWACFACSPGSASAANGHLREPMSPGGAPGAVRMASLATGLLSIGTILGCLLVPYLAERVGRRSTLALYFVGMAICIWLSFGWAFYLANGLATFITVLFFLGFFGGNFATFSLWLPEQYGTAVRATAFAFPTFFGRFLGPRLNFLLGLLVSSYRTRGNPGG